MSNETDTTVSQWTSDEDVQREPRRIRLSWLFLFWVFGCVATAMLFLWNYLDGVVWTGNRYDNPNPWYAGPAMFVAFIMGAASVLVAIVSITNHFESRGKKDNR